MAALAIGVWSGGFVSRNSKMENFWRRLGRRWEGSGEGMRKGESERERSWGDDEVYNVSFLCL